jgi:tRNA 5-methylaminomethyl-2-thiouridine biosynthesis bifunctional protein
MFERLSWRDGRPFSCRFGDVYASTDALAESEHIYIDGNQLKNRWKSFGRNFFSVGELGFGLGINFFLTWKLFLEIAPSDKILHFISAEAYPIHPDDLRKAYDLYPTISSQSKEFLEKYVAISPGAHRICLANGRVILTLLIGDAYTLWNDYHTLVDAWMLDGFSPSCNPDMWQDSLCKVLGERSIPYETTLASFSVAGWIRKGLINHGFSIEKMEGHGKKRHITVGYYLETKQQQKWKAPWFCDMPQYAKDHAIIVGAGISGATLANALARRGWNVTILEKEPNIAQGASGNRQGVFHFKPSIHHDPLQEFMSAAYSFALRESIEHRHACGVLQIAINSSEEYKMKAILANRKYEHLCYWLDKENSTYKIGLPLRHSGMFFSQSGWVHPYEWIQSLLTHPNIQVKTGIEVNECVYNEKLDCWAVLKNHEGINQAYHSKVLILANHDYANQFSHTSWIPLKTIRGQVSRVTSTLISQKLSSVICSDHYLTPSVDEQHSLGASFRHQFDHLDATNNERIENISSLEHMLSDDVIKDFYIDHDDIKNDRVGLRTTSPDYLPILGAIPDEQLFLSIYAKLSHDRKLRLSTPCPWLKGLYIHCAHSARGLSSASLASEYIACQITGEPSPLLSRMDHFLMASRFLIRKLATHPQRH